MAKPCVLLVDDNEATCILVTAILQRDFSTEVAHDGAQALEKLKTGRYVSIVLDLRMPPPDGFAVMDLLMESNPELLARIVILSAAMSPRERERTKKYPVFDVIAKPFDVETLLATVKKCAVEALSVMRYPLSETSDNG